MSSYLISSLDEPAVLPADVPAHLKEKKEEYSDNESSHPIAKQDNASSEDFVKRKVAFNFKSASPNEPPLYPLANEMAMKETLKKNDSIQEPFLINDANEAAAAAKVAKNESLDLIVSSGSSLKVPLYYELKIDLKHGKNLAIRDRSGNLHINKFLIWEYLNTNKYTQINRHKWSLH